MFKKPQLPEVEPVKLKSFCGIRPGVYILAIVFAFLLLIAFLLFLLPGLMHDTAYISTDERVRGSGVYEDGIYLGSGNSSVFLTSSGTHIYTFTYEGVTYSEKTITVPRQYFFTLYSHKQTPISSDFSGGKEFVEKVEKAFIRDISLYSAVIDSDDSFHYPPLFSTYAANMALSGEKDVRDIWLLGASHITGPELYDDYKEGRKILEENDIEFFTEELGEIEAFLSSLFSGDKVTLSYSSSSSASSLPRKDGSFFVYSEGSITMGRSVENTIEGVKEAPITLSYPSFAIDANVVTEHEWALFVEANPKWAKSNIDQLIAEGLVDENYLKGITVSTYVNSIRPIRGISWYAAQAYVEWKSKMDGVTYHIPTEVEWTVAARSGEEKEYVTSLVFVENNASSPTAMLGQLWEFTSTPYVPLSRVSDYERVIALALEAGQYDIIVKGGSYISDPKKIDRESVGVQTRSECSDFTGFRIARYE